jgi:hypothetical protein
LVVTANVRFSSHLVSITIYHSTNDVRLALLDLIEYLVRIGREIDELILLAYRWGVF